MESKHTAIVRVHRPDLTQEERVMRMAAIKKAAEDVLRATIHKGGTS